MKYTDLRAEIVTNHEVKFIGMCLQTIGMLRSANIIYNNNIDKLIENLHKVKYVDIPNKELKQYLTELQYKIELLQKVKEQCHLKLKIDAHNKLCKEPENFRLTEWVITKEENKILKTKHNVNFLDKPIVLLRKHKVIEYEPIIVNKVKITPKIFTPIIRDEKFYIEVGDYLKFDIESLDEAKEILTKKLLSVCKDRLLNSKRENLFFTKYQNEFLNKI